MACGQGIPGVLPLCLPLQQAVDGWATPLPMHGTTLLPEMALWGVKHRFGARVSWATMCIAACGHVQPLWGTACGLGHLCSHRLCLGTQVQRPECTTLRTS